MSRSRRFALSIVLPAALAMGFVAAVAGPSAAGASRARPSTPAGAAHITSHPHAAARGGTQRAVVVRSWGNCGAGSLIWDDLNANWSSYGTIPISIDYSDPALCGTDAVVTLAALEANGAQTVILSDLAGGNQQWSPAEVGALKQYAQQGHNVIGTFVSFVWGSIDNTALLPLFGLSQAQTYGGGINPITPTYNLRFPGLPLFRDVGNPYVSSGYNFAQTPADGVWSANELTSGRLVGRNADGQAAIVVRKAPTYYSIYIANMPEYQGATADKQFFYNAIIFPAT
jgi:hypothetical protein